MHDGLTLLIRAAWRDLPLAARIFAAPDAVVSLGEGTGWRWSLGGVPIGWVPGGLSAWLSASPPGLSTVEAAARGDFLVPTGALASAVRPVWHRVPGGCVVDVDPAWRACVHRAGATLFVGPGLGLVELGAADALTFAVGGVGFSTRLVPSDAVRSRRRSGSRP